MKGSFLCLKLFKENIIYKHNIDFRAERTKSKEREKGTKHTEKPAKSTKQQKDESDDSELEDEGEGGRIIGGVYIPPPPIPVCSVENIGPRLIITHIVNINFKSYAGRQVLGPFHKVYLNIYCIHLV